MGISKEITKKLNYFDYSLFNTINDIFLKNFQKLNSKNCCMEDILEIIDNKLYDKYIFMNTKKENVDINNNFNISRDEQDHIGGINFNNKDKEEIENSKEKKELNNYFKINNDKILMELFNTIEIFDKSENKDQNSKKVENSENDGWEFQKDLTRKNFFIQKYKESNKLKEIKFLNTNEKKSELNLNRLNSNLNSHEFKNEKEKLEFSNKNINYKISIANANLNDEKFSINNLLNFKIAKDDKYEKNIKKIYGNKKKCSNNSRSENIERTITLNELNKNEKLKSEIEYGIKSQIKLMTLFSFFIYLFIILRFKKLIVKYIYQEFQLNLYL